MAQFDVYRNNDPETQELYPYLLDVQADLLSDLPTRLVVPLVFGSAIKRPIPVLNPELEIDHVRLFMFTQQMAGVSQQLLVVRVCSVKDLRSRIIDALDLAFTGY